MDFAESPLPTLANLDWKAIAVRRIFIAPAITRIAVNGQRTRLHKRFRGPRSPRDRFSQNAHGIYSRIHDFAPVLRCVTAVHALPGEVEDCFRAINAFSPGAEALPIPLQVLNSILLM